jgi:hypothetical protein
VPVCPQNEYQNDSHGPVLPKRTVDYLDHGAPVGSRNDELFAAAQQFRDAGYTSDEASGYLGPRAEKDGLRMAEILATIRSAYKREPRSPLFGKNGEGSPNPARSAGLGSPPTKTQSVNSSDPHVSLPPPITDGLKIVLETCFQAGEHVGISDTNLNSDGEAKPRSGDVRSRESWLKILSNGPITRVYSRACEGLFIRINPLIKKGKSDKDVTAFRFCLVEFDLDQNGNRIPKELQYAILLKSNLPISVIIDSGNKSIHAWVWIDAPDRAEFDRRRQLAWDYFEQEGLSVDPQNKNPSRYSRCPDVDRNLYDENKNIIGTGRQALLAVKVGAPSWEEWEKAEDYTDKELREFDKRETDRYLLRDRKLPRPMDDAAFYGLAGEIVDIITGVSEPCREAILSQFMVAFGNILGRTLRCYQSAEHHLNEFAVLVGKTSIGRKGSAWRALENLLRTLGDNWVLNRVRRSFQSGEAIVHAVRDAGMVPAGRGQRHDPGVSDKRLLILAEEFSRILTIGNRKGNTLFSTLRECFDAPEKLQTEGKIAPEEATGAHVSLIGHVTQDQLLQQLQNTENENGTTNRILWLVVHRSKKIPRPRWIRWKAEYPHIVQRLENIVQTFRNPNIPEREMSWSQEGQLEWDKFYNIERGDQSGLLGQIIARTESHVLRLTMLYTALDCSTLMEPKHLRAAIAFWDYCERSAKWIFAEKTGNKIADKILWELRREAGGILRDDISRKILSSNCPAVYLEMAFSLLVQLGLVRVQHERSKTRKKPAQRWFANNV